MRVAAGTSSASCAAKSAPVTTSRSERRCCLSGMIMALANYSESPLVRSLGLWLWTIGSSERTAIHIIHRYTIALRGKSPCLFVNPLKPNSITLSWSLKQVADLLASWNLVSISPLESIQNQSTGLYTPYKNLPKIFCDVGRGLMARQITLT